MWIIMHGLYHIHEMNADAYGVEDVEGQKENKLLFGI
jgi:hypothetical protein